VGALAARVGAGRFGRGRQSLRLRLSLLYGGLFLASGAALLATSYVLVARLPLANLSTRVPVRVLLTRGQAGVRFHLIGAGAASERSAVLHALLLRSGLVISLMALVSLWLGWLMAGRVLRPLRMITATARQISGETLHRRLALAGSQDELQELGDTIDGLLARLEQAFAAQRSFVANASHELRTPLTAMRVSIDVAARKSPPLSKDASALAGRIRAELDQADRTLESLLVLARAQGGAITDLGPVSLKALTAAALDSHAGAAASRGITVLSTLDEVAVTGDPTLLSRLAMNLIDNAIRHNELAGEVEVRLESVGPTARLSVENGGPHLPADTVGQLIEPFRRLVADRTGSDDGVGLGLSIVAAIAAAHGGSLALSSRVEGGLRAVVSLPRAAESPGTDAS